MTWWVRGRVLAIDGEHAIVRSQLRDVRVRTGPDWRVGDLVRVELDAPSTTTRSERVRGYDGPPYPGPRTEVARLPRTRLAHLLARAKALASVRAFFDERDFVEVETPLLVPSPGLEIHLDAVAAGNGYLITSPEYQMKRLLAGGFERIYQVCKCFRGNEQGPHHAGEFTMIEWYRAFDSLASIVDDTEQLVSRVVRDLAVGSAPPEPSAIARPVLARIGDRTVDVTPPWHRITVHDAMREHAGVEVHGDEPAEQLTRAVRAAGIAVADGTAWDDAFFAAFLARVDPALAALDRAVILHDWPAPLAALARRHPDDARTALRFEAYVGGIELANAFDELVDPVEQRARFEDDLRIRRSRGRAEYPVDEKLLAALAEGVPPSAGIALGFDRLVMLATGAPTIDQVLTFTASEL